MAKDKEQPLTRTQELQAQVLEGVGDTGRPSTPATVLIRVAAWMAVAVYTPKLANAHPASAEAWSTSLFWVCSGLNELGCLVFAALGDGWDMACGTLMQLLIPILCVLSFTGRADKLMATLSIWFLGGSLATISPYIYNAQALDTGFLDSLVGSPHTEKKHWAYRLEFLGLLDESQEIGWVVQGLAGTLMWGAIIWSGLLLWGQWQSRYAPPKMGRYYRPLK